METTKMSFGEKGGVVFAGLNILQLAGWTAIMIYDGAASVDRIFSVGKWVWCLIIGGLIILWILIGIQNLGKLNTIAMAGLFLLTIVLSFVIFRKNEMPQVPAESMSFGAAVELSAAMPISWMSLIGDYTREAKHPKRATLVSVTVYGCVSCWMYGIGMGAAIFTGESEIADIFVRAGLGIAGLLTIVFSTVTTTFLDAWSAGISCETIAAKRNGKWCAVIVAGIGTMGAMLFPLDDITDFLYLIGSVFVPMIAIQIADFFILKKDFGETKCNFRNLAVWFAGFVIYRLLMKVDLLLGSTLPDTAATILLCVAVEKVSAARKRRAY